MNEQSLGLGRTEEPSETVRARPLPTASGGEGALDFARFAERLRETICECVVKNTTLRKVSLKRELHRRDAFEEALHSHILDVIRMRELTIDATLTRQVQQGVDDLKKAGASEAFFAILDFADQVDAIAAQSSALANDVGFLALSRSLDRIYSLNGYQRIITSDCDFNPTLHVFLGSAASASVPKGRVLREIQRGYHHNNTPLRCASVIVSSGIESTQS
jgi:molecular chaperone GrpE (heat shock protein)